MCYLLAIRVRIGAVYSRARVNKLVKHAPSPMHLGDRKKERDPLYHRRALALYTFIRAQRSSVLYTAGVKRRAMRVPRPSRRQPLRPGSV